MEEKGPHALEMGKEEEAQAQKENAEKGRRALGLTLQHFFIFLYKSFSFIFRRGFGKNPDYWFSS